MIEGLASIGGEWVGEIVRVKCPSGIPRSSSIRIIGIREEREVDI